MLLIGVPALLVTIAGLAIINPGGVRGSLWTRSDTMIALLLLQSVWLIGAYAAIIRSVDPGTTLRAVAPRRGRLRALQAAVLLTFPHYPAFVSQGALHESPPNSWTYVRGLIGSGLKDDAETRRVDGARVKLALQWR